MPDPTLADVLAALDSDGCDTGEGEGPSNGTVELALQWILANRTALERMALEQAARKAVGASDGTPVRVLPTDDAPELFTVHYEDSDCCMVEVGANWKPEAGR